MRRSYSTVRSYHLVLQFSFHLLDVVCLLWLIVRNAGKELGDVVIACTVVRIGRFRLLQHLRSAKGKEFLYSQTYLFLKMS